MKKLNILDKKENHYLHKLQNKPTKLQFFIQNLEKL